MFPQHQVIPCRVVRQHCPAPFDLNKAKLITISKYIVQSFFKALIVIHVNCSVANNFVRTVLGRIQAPFYQVKRALAALCGPEKRLNAKQTVY
jgi:hypothetical protein